MESRGERRDRASEGGARRSAAGAGREGARWVYSRGWSGTDDKRVCLSSSSLAVAGLALCPSALTCCCCCCCCCPSPSPPALRLPRDVRRQLTFDRLLGARIIFELLAIVAAAAAAAGCCCPLPLSWGIETDSAQEGYMRVGYARCRRGVCFLCRVCNQNVSCRALCRCR